MTAILLAAMLALAPQQQTSEGNGARNGPRNGTIEGVVTRFGTSDPLPDVEISLNAAGRPLNGLTPEALTDSKGRFSIEDVPPGSYTVQAVRSGYANPSPNGVRIEEGGAKRIVVVRAGQRSEPAMLSLVLGGVVSGHIFNWAGESLANRPIFVRSVDDPDHRNTTDPSDDHGVFHIAGIEPGKYYLTIGANGDFQPETYFPGVADKNSAKVIEIREGAILNGMEWISQGFPYAIQRLSLFRVMSSIGMASHGPALILRSSICCREILRERKPLWHGRTESWAPVRFMFLESVPASTTSIFTQPPMLVSQRK